MKKDLLQIRRVHAWGPLLLALLLLVLGNLVGACTKQQEATALAVLNATEKGCVKLQQLERFDRSGTVAKVEDVCAPAGDVRDGVQLLQQLRDQVEAAAAPPAPPPAASSSSSGAPAALSPAPAPAALLVPAFRPAAGAQPRALLLRVAPASSGAPPPPAASSSPAPSSSAAPRRR